MLDRLFVYGTLLAPELRVALIGRALDGTPARLDGYVCCRVRRAPYPAIIAAPGASTEGEIVSDLSAAELDILDRFESTLYQRLTVNVTDQHGQSVEAYTYVITDDASTRLTNESWDYATFRLRHLDRYIKAV